jgi:MoaA/NifB/PqqE/SkfB family radical SAM enzyme
MTESINFAITDRCDRICPECCCNIPSLKSHWDISVPELTQAAQQIKRIEHLILTGGEPSLHPNFLNIVPLLKGLFNCGSLEIETNGFLFKKNLSIFIAFDRISITNYTAPEFTPNKDLIEIALKSPELKGKVFVGNAMHHTPRTHRGLKKCERAFIKTVSVYKNRMYPCCMGWGIEDPVSIPLTENWREEIIKVKLPCSRCFFAI